MVEYCGRELCQEVFTLPGIHNTTTVTTALQLRNSCFLFVVYLCETKILFQKRVKSQLMTSLLRSPEHPSFGIFIYQSTPTSPTTLFPFVDYWSNIGERGHNSIFSGGPANIKVLGLFLPSFVVYSLLRQLASFDK